jgi:hypothetical protein
MSNCETEFCDKFYVKKLKANPFVVFTKSTEPKGYRNTIKKNLKRARVFCISKYCNPSCKDTLITEKRNTPAMKKEFNEYLKQHKFWVSAKEFGNYKKNVRKTVKKYKDPLKNGFYRGLSSSEMAMLKDAGATSGCVPELQRHLRY